MKMVQLNKNSRAGGIYDKDHKAYWNELKIKMRAKNIIATLETSPNGKVIAEMFYNYQDWLRGSKQNLTEIHKNSKIEPRNVDKWKESLKLLRSVKHKWIVLKHII